MKNHNRLKPQKKGWTVLIYADGNNDLAPEIYNGFEKIKNEPISDEVNIVVQLAIAPHKLVNILRPKVSFQASDFKGAGRYMVNHEGSSLVHDLGNVNMADPATLFDFIVWGVANYPSKHIMVILSGHGAGFAGAMNDYTHGYPYIMSIQGIVSALSQCKKITGKKIDCLVLDTCYMNLVEVWYEFACTYDQPVKYLIGPLKNIGLEGLPCHLIIRYLQERSNYKLNMRDTLDNIVNNTNKGCGIFNGILAVRLKKKAFIKLKNEINKIADFIVKNNIHLVDLLADWYCYKESYPLISLLGLEDTLASRFLETYTYKLNIQKILDTIVISPKLTQLPQNQNLGPSLYLPAGFRQYLYLKDYYDSLLFSNDNRWLQVLQGNKIKEINNTHESILTYYPLPPPMPMPIGSVASVILEQNPTFTHEQAWEIVKDLGWY